METLEISLENSFDEIALKKREMSIKEKKNQFKS